MNIMMKKLSIILSCMLCSCVLHIHAQNASMLVAITLNAEDYLSANPAQADITDGLLENIVDESQNSPIPQAGNFSRFLAGAWRSPEGLTFVYNTSYNVNRASIRNVTFRYIRSLARYGFSAACENGKHHRAVHFKVKSDALSVCEVNFENYTNASPMRRSFICGNSNLKATLRNVAGNGRLIAVNGKLHPIAVDITIENSLFRSGDKPDSLPDVSLGGNVMGRIVFCGLTG